ncbi:hypothetical protein ElyMa_004864900 [Elysia marginata]|uniref:Uncharacterized protein n=1 Tax=Elysia marginata TaxID=1093978 RepID=A0AAV4IQ12_9GAST|nr:hypothetical protein ElyMa_004864900 [Elysia marginata]
MSGAHAGTHAGAAPDFAGDQLSPFKLRPWLEWHLTLPAINCHDPHCDYDLAGSRPPGFPGITTTSSTVPEAMTVQRNQSM